MYARRLAGQSLVVTKLVRGSHRTAKTKSSPRVCEGGELAGRPFLLRGQSAPLLDPNNGSHDTHNVKVLVRSHLPLIGGISFISIAGRSKRAQPSSGGF